MTFDYDVTRLPVLFSEGIEEEPPRRRAMAPVSGGASALQSLLRLLRRSLTPLAAAPSHRQARSIQ